MKRRIFAVILLVLMLIPLFSLTVYAFPFNEFNREDHTLDISILYDSTDYEKYIVADGLMLARTIEYQGSKPDSGRAIYTQTARLEIALPDGYFDYAKYSYKTDPDKYVFNAGESETWFNQYAVNSVDYGIYYTIKDVTIYQVERYGEDKDKTVAELMEREVDKYRNRKENESNQADDPFTIRAESDGYSIILHYQQPTVFGARSDGLPISAGYDVFDCVSDEWTYIRFMSFPELPGIFMRAIFTQKISKTIEIEDESNKKASDFYPNDGDWQPHYNNAIERIEGFLKLHLGERFLDMASRVSITWNDPVISDEYGKTENEEKPPATSGITQNAEQNPGEDGGVSVPAAIVIGVAGGGAAIAGAAAASGGSDNKKKKSYKMYVQKDFGDAIRRGGDKPVKIRARMAEVDENGVEHDRNDLTEKIGVSADGMTVHGAALVGRYCEATVSVPKEYDKDTASITFTFFGEGGEFTNTVIFRIVDGPQLKFVNEEDGTLYHENCGIDAIPGDGFTYTERFAVVDAPVAPKLSDISAVNTGEFDVEFALTDQPALYKMTVKNNTKPDSEHDIFAKPVDKNFEIHVNVEGEKEPVKGYVTVKLYPEGITVSSTMEGKKNDVKYVRVQAYEKEYAGDLDRKWQVSEIKFTLAYKGKDKAIIDPKEAQYKFEKIKGGDGLGGTHADKEQSIAEKFEYNESYGILNDKFTYDFEPNSTLCEPDDGKFFIVFLPCTAEYGGEEYQADIPLRLRGKDFDPMAGWEEEYDKLKGRIEKFSLPENKDDLLKRLASLAEDPRCTTEELRLTSKWIVRQYMTYWTIQSMKSQDEARVYDVIIDYLEWAKFFGDCAFSILVNMYAGPVADAIISPTKDFLAEAIGEAMACWMRGQSVNPDNFNFSKNVFQIFDNFVSGNISFANWKQAAYTLGAYFAFASIKNFYMTLREENKFDLYGAIIHGFADTTATGLKAAAGHLFDAALKKCPGFRAKMSAWCGSFVSKHLGSSATMIDLRAVDGLTRSEILRKYLDGLFGMGIDKLVELDTKIHDKFISSQSGFEFNSDGHVIVTFYFEVNDKNYECAVDVNKALSDAVSKAGQIIAEGGLFAYLFNELYGSVPFSASVIDVPKDPPLPPAKN